MKRNRSRSLPVIAEVCEERALLSASAVAPALQVFSNSSQSGVISTTTLQSRWVYGTGAVLAAQNCQGYSGKGQTIAVVEAMHDPTLSSDVAQFERQFVGGGSFVYPPLNSLNGPTLKVFGQNGTSTLPTGSNAGTLWQMEEALDVEYAHLMAPQANIVVVEANSSSFAAMIAAAQSGAHIPGVSVVSMSWGVGEFAGENLYDQLLAHPGVTFVASAGDHAGQLQYPAVSPNVVEVGGTNLSSQYGFYGGETLWANTPIGKSLYESGRGTPDVVATAGTVDIVSNGTVSVVGGTSVSAPIWAAVIAEADQWRAAHWPSWASQAVTPGTLSELPAQDFHHVAGGGMGAPIGNYVVSDLGAYDTSGADKLVFLNRPSSITVGVPTTIQVAVENADGQIVTSDNSQVTLWMMGGIVLSQANAVHGIATFTVTFTHPLGFTFLQARDGWLTIDSMSSSVEDWQTA